MKKFKNQIFALIVTFVLTSLITGCSKSDTGKCTITFFSYDDVVYENISLEECQNKFHHSAGANGWGWDPE